MKVEDAHDFGIVDLKEGGYIGCPVCKTFTPHWSWQEAVVGYESCPVPLYAIVCPQCGRTFDELYDTKLKFNVRSPQK